MIYEKDYVLIFFTSVTNTRSSPTSGVNNKVAKKYPQNPNFLFDPMNPIKIAEITKKSMYGIIVMHSLQSEFLKYHETSL